MKREKLRGHSYRYQELTAIYEATEGLICSYGVPPGRLIRARARDPPTALDGSGAKASSWGNGGQEVATFCEPISLLQAA